MSTRDTRLLEFAIKYWGERIRSFEKGKILYFQGDPVENLFLVGRGAVKLSSVSEEGKIYSHGILGAGHLLGVTDYFLDSIHDTTAEVIEAASIFAIPQSEFQNLITKNTDFSALVMRELATETKRHSAKAQDLSFLDTQHRLMNSLKSLAAEHGLETDRGIEIDVDITHEDMGELVNANRTTISLCLKELKKLGYVHTEGRRIVLVPVHHIEILEELSESLLHGMIGEATYWTQSALGEKIDPRRILNSLATAMKRVDNQYIQGHIDLTDVMWAAKHMIDALPIIEEDMRGRDMEMSFLGKIVFGTVHGDVHDIGKMIVSMLLKARGFEVIDLGVEVPTETFVEAVRQHKPDVLAMSALLSTTRQEMKKVIDALQEANLRDKVKVMIGGAPTTPRFAQEIGADGYGFEARDGVELAWGWCTKSE